MVLLLMGNRKLWIQSPLLFPGQDPLGHTVQLLPSMYANEWARPAEVVGVARGIRNTGQALEPEPEVYATAWFQNSSTAYYAIRTQAGTATAAAFLKQAAADLDPALPVTIEPADEQVARLTERPRLLAWLLSAFAGLALLLAAVGLYGVASYLVTQRTRDIGVRIALGAAPADISRQIVGEAGRWIAAGAVLGCALAWAGTRAIEAQLYGSPRAILFPGSQRWGCCAPRCCSRCCTPPLGLRASIRWKRSVRTRRARNQCCQLPISV